MESMDRLTELRENGTMQWSGEQRAWVAEPDAVVSALAHDGFEEYKREDAAGSLVAILAGEGKVGIRVVERGSRLR